MLWEWERAVTAPPPSIFVEQVWPSFFDSYETFIPLGWNLKGRRFILVVGVKTSMLRQTKECLVSSLLPKPLQLPYRSVWIQPETWWPRGLCWNRWRQFPILLVKMQHVRCTQDCCWPLLHKEIKGLSQVGWTFHFGHTPCCPLAAPLAQLISLNIPSSLSPGASKYQL